MENINSKKVKEAYKLYIKRALDIITSSLALVSLSPILVATATLVRIKLGAPVVFKQPRPGKDEKIFYLYKFRSMTNEVGPDGRLLPDAQRLTKFGRFLRASSLDELLELINIIKGDMSIVGPRPLSMFYLPHYPTEYRKRHSVRPGLTGLAQVNGRNNLIWDDRFAYDVAYAENVSFLLDARIALDTVFKVLKRSNVSVRGTAKMLDYGPYSILKEESAGGRQADGMTYSEIGSYFWLDGNENSLSELSTGWLPAVEDSCFAFSGRNAIDIAIRDILNEHVINRIYVPSYSCVSMLQAFIDRGLKIIFYEVEYEEGEFTYQLPKADGNSVVLIMSYFGLCTKKAHQAIENLQRQGAVIIEDITHSLLRDKPAYEESDYLVASLRKWFAVPTGGWVGKRYGRIDVKPDIESDHAVEDKIAGMHEKYDYLIGKISSKESFLLAQSKFDNDLIHVDRMLKIDNLSRSIIERTNIESVKARRRENAKVLLNGLKVLGDKGITFPKVDLTEDTPLFLPIFMKMEDRESLRKYLIGKGIYCPIHWPEVMGAKPGIRQNELSLICDQRYSERDMEAILNAIKDWFQEQQYK